VSAEQIVAAAKAVRLHGGDYRHGTHASILWRLVDGAIGPAKKTRAPHLDRPCMGGNHYTLGYYRRADSADRETIYECPNQGCGLYKKEVA
jgi:hypothetical protein